ncbi:hypothetical protein M758_12G103700 [Ceratodon purpureus]|nr:hypothetical protein M758_12G103700 [Ceratodon purpureus]
MVSPKTILQDHAVGFFLTIQSAISIDYLCFHNSMRNVSGGNRLENPETSILFLCTTSVQHPFKENVVIERLWQLNRNIARHSRAIDMHEPCSWFHHFLPSPRV